MEKNLTNAKTLKQQLTNFLRQFSDFWVKKINDNLFSINEKRLCFWMVNICFLSCFYKQNINKIKLLWFFSLMWLHFAINENINQSKLFKIEKFFKK